MCKECGKSSHKEPYKPSFGEGASDFIRAIEDSKKRMKAKSVKKVLDKKK